MRSHRYFAVVFFVVGLSSGQAVGFAQSAEPDPSVRVTIPIAGAPTLGPDDAPVTIVEFSDFYCPYCRRANETLATLLRVYPEKIRVVYHHSLLNSKTGSLAAEATLAAQAEGKFWPLHDRFFAGPVPHDISELSALAGEVGLDPVVMKRALTSRAYRDELEEKTQLAESLGLRGVPYFFINGRALSGAHPLSTFVRIIDEELTLAKTQLRAGLKGGDLYTTMLAREGDVLAAPEDIFRRGVKEGAKTWVGLGRQSNHLGPAEPLVTIVEFSDYTCGYCRQLHPLLIEIQERHPSDVRIVFRHFPLGELLKPVAEAAEEAGRQGKFWEFSARVFADPDNAHATRAELLEHGRAAGLDLEALRNALDEHTHAQTISIDAAEAAGVGVKGTPTMFINGRPMVGSPPPEVFAAAIEGELARVRELLAIDPDRGTLYERLRDQDEQ